MPSPLEGRSPRITHTTHEAGRPQGPALRSQPSVLIAGVPHAIAVGTPSGLAPVKHLSAVLGPMPVAAPGAMRVGEAQPPRMASTQDAGDRETTDQQMVTLLRATCEHVDLQRAGRLASLSQDLARHRFDLDAMPAGQLADLFFSLDALAGRLPAAPALLARVVEALVGRLEGLAASLDAPAFTVFLKLAERSAALSAATLGLLARKAAGVLPLLRDRLVQRLDGVLQAVLEQSVDRISERMAALRLEHALVLALENPDAAPGAAEQARALENLIAQALTPEGNVLHPGPRPSATGALALKLPDVASVFAGRRLEARGADVHQEVDRNEVYQAAWSSTDNVAGARRERLADVQLVRRLVIEAVNPPYVERAGDQYVKVADLFDAQGRATPLLAQVGGHFTGNRDFQALCDFQAAARGVGDAASMTAAQALQQATSLKAMASAQSLQRWARPTATPFDVGALRCSDRERPRELAGRLADARIEAEQKIVRMENKRRDDVARAQRQRLKQAQGRASGSISPRASRPAEGRDAERSSDSTTLTARDTGSESSLPADLLPGRQSAELFKD